LPTPAAFAFVQQLRRRTAWAKAEAKSCQHRNASAGLCPPYERGDAALPDPVEISARIV
jgi:hypothetical protein